MPYNSFTISTAIKQFNLIIKDKYDLFGGIDEIQPSAYLESTLTYNLPLASEINTEKSRLDLSW